MADRLRSIRRTSPASTDPGPISTNVPTPRSRSYATDCVKRTGAVSCSTSRRGIASACSSPLLTVEKNGIVGSRNSTCSTAARSVGSAEAVSGLWKPPETLRRIARRAPAASADGHQRLHAVHGAGDDHLARTVVVGGPDAVDLVAEALDDLVIEPDDGGHGARLLGGSGSGRDAALAHEPHRGGGVESARGHERGVLADAVADHEIGARAGSRHRREARERGA